MSYSPATQALAGKTKKPKKTIKEIVTRKAKGGVIHTHHFTHPEHHAPEEHISANDQAMIQHMMQNMSTGNPGAPAPTDDVAAAPQAGPQGAPAPPGM